MKKYWHRLSQKTIDKILESEITGEECLKQYKQPYWCGHPNALAGIMGCWSLTDDRPGGLRTKISRKFCESCDCYIKSKNK